MTDDALLAAIREADAAFLEAHSQTWYEDYLLPALRRHGLEITVVANGSAPGKNSEFGQKATSTEEEPPLE